MARLSRLRNSLDFMPSPVEDRPGLLIRDPLGYSDATLIIPPALVHGLELFDGEHDEFDLKERLVRATGSLDAAEWVNRLRDALSQAGFLEDDAFHDLRSQAERRFADQPERPAVHAGSGYPDDPTELRSTLADYMLASTGPERPSIQANKSAATGSVVTARYSASSAPRPDGRTIGIAAPHVSPFGGVESYRAAYSALGPEDADRTFIVLGTSHYGEPDRLGLTRKPYVTPYGASVTDTSFVDQLAAAAGHGAFLEDYCHSVEHSIEFQIVFLQHLYGPRVRVVPILVGAFFQSLYHGGLPEDHEPVRRAFGALGELAAREGDCLRWVLGVDMAHIGRRYGDPLDAHAGEGAMLDVERRDRARIGTMAAADSRAFWDLVAENRDDLKWCGSAPFYTFLKAVPDARADLRHYQQWNIDERSVVSFAGMSFHGSA